MYIKDAWRVLWRGLPLPPVSPLPTIVEKVLIVDKDVRPGKVYGLRSSQPSRTFSDPPYKGYYKTCADAFSDGEINDVVEALEGYISLDGLSFYGKSYMRFDKPATITQQGNNRAPREGDPYLES